MTKLLKYLLFAWIVIGPLALIKLYSVRNSGIYLGVALLSVLLVLVALHLLRQADDFPWRSRLTVPLFALALAAIAAGLQGAIFYDRRVLGEHRYLLVQIYAVALICLSTGAAFAVATLVRTREDILWIRRLIIGVTVVFMVQTTVRFEIVTGTRWWGLVASHAMAMVIASVLFERHSSRWPYVLGVAFAAGIVADLMLIPFFGNVRAQWLSGWIAVGVPAALLLLVRFPRGVVALVLPLALGLLYWNFDLVMRVVELSRKEGDFLRFRLWEDAVRLALHRPLLGLGPGNYLDYIVRYGQLGALMSSPHGNYQQLAAETGLVGLGFMVWLFSRALALGWRLFRAASDPTVRALAIAATCSLAGQFCAAFLGDFVLPSYHNGGYHNLTATIFTFIVMGLLMSLERLEGATKGGAQT